MPIAIIAIAVLGAALVVLRAALRRRQAEQGQDDGLHSRRIGDGLRRLETNKRKYAVLTEALLAQTPDDRLLEAVLSNLWAKMAPDLSDAADVMRGQSMPRREIYALYAVTGAANQEGLAALLATPEAEMLPVALDALGRLGMPQSAALLAAAMAAEDPDAQRQAYLEACEGESGKVRMAEVIRRDPRAFCDA